MKKTKLLFAAALLLCTAGAWAQSDVTSTYLTNAGFDDCTAESSNVAVKTKKNYSSDGWTTASSGDYTTIAVTAYGGGVNVGSYTTPGTKKDGTTVTGNTLGIVAGWADDVKLQSGDITLPPGVYTLSVDHYLTSSTNNYTTSRFGFVTASTTYLVSSTSFTASTWTTETVTFTLTESTTGKIQIGLKGENKTGSGAPAVFYDDVTLTQYSDDDLRTIHGLTTADYATPVVTDFVVNGTFDSNINGWSRTGSFSNNQRQTGKSAPFDGGFYENWNSSAKVNKMYQTINNIPNGTYRLDIAAFVNTLASPNESQYVYANNDKTYLTAAGDPPVEYEVYTVVTTNQIEIGLEQTTATANWMAIDNVSLRYYGAGDVITDAQNASHKLAWEEALAAAEAAYADDAYTNVTGSEKTDLATEIAKAEPSTADDYDAATAALISATSTFTAAKPAYDALVTEIAYAKTLNVSTTTAEAAHNSEASATSVTTAVQALKVLEYTSLNTAYPNNVTTSLLGTWEAGNYGTTNGQGYSSDETYYDKWNGSATNLSSSKTVTLPEGSYVVRVAGRGVSTTTMNLSVKVGDADAISTPFLMTGDTGKGIDTNGATNFSNEGTYSNNNDGRGWQYRYITFTTDGTGDVVITINGHLEGNTWQSFYAPVLLCDNTTAGDIYAGETEYTALNSAISTAEAKTLGFESGQYAPYNNVVALQALADAKAIDQTAELTNFKTDVEAATAALTGATWTANTEDVDAIYNGTFSMELTGWTRTNIWGQQRNDVDTNSASSNYGYYNQPGSLQYGNQGVYTMPLKANTVYELSFKYASWENNSNNKLTVSVLNGENGMAAMEFEGNGKKYNTEGAFVTKTLVFVTGDAGDYVLTLANDGNTVMTDVSITKATSQVLEFADGSVPSYAPGTYPTVKITRSLTADRWATAVYPFAVSKSAGLKIATLSSYNASTGTLDFAAPNASTANVPFLMRSTADISEITLTNVEVAAASATIATADEASLIGVYAATDIDKTDKNYVLSANKIYSVGTAGATINPYRAYIQIEQASDVKALNFFIDGDEATGIETIDNGQQTTDNGVIYNVAGQRLNKMQKGINIVNGKKVLF